MAIKYDKKLNQRLQRAVKNANAKISRLERAGVDAIPLLPVSMREIKSSFYKRKDLIYKIQELEAFTKRGSEKINQQSGLTNYQTFVAKKQRRRSLLAINKEITKAFENIDPMKPATKAKFSKLLSIRKAISGKLKGIKTFRKIIAEYERLFSNTREQNFYNNFFEMMYKEIGELNLSDDIKNKLEKLRQLKPDQLLKLQEEHPAFKAISEWYPKMDEYGEMNTSELENAIGYISNNVDEIIKLYKK